MTIGACRTGQSPAGPAACRSRSRAGRPGRTRTGAVRRSRRLAGRRVARHREHDIGTVPAGRGGLPGRISEGRRGCTRQRQRVQAADRTPAGGIAAEEPGRRARIGEREHAEGVDHAAGLIEVAGPQRRPAAVTLGERGQHGVHGRSAPVPGRDPGASRRFVVQQVGRIGQPSREDLPGGPALPAARFTESGRGG